MQGCAEAQRRQLTVTLRTPRRQPPPSIVAGDAARELRRSRRLAGEPQADPRRRAPSSEAPTDATRRLLPGNSSLNTQLTLRRSRDLVSDVTAY